MAKCKNPYWNMPKEKKMKWYYWLILAGLLVVAITVILMMGMSTQNV